MTRPVRAPRASAALARRLRELREARWPGRAVTQRTLAEALGGDKPLAVSSISAYENQSNPSPVSDPRLRDYATFFATPRSIVGDSGRILADEELTPDELAARDELLRELEGLRDAADEGTAAAEPSTWTFPEGEPVRIICGQLEDMTHPYSRPEAPNYTKLLSYADADALVELFGHIRMRNPESDVRFTQELSRPDDLACHLVMLGGTGLNLRLQELLDRTALPIEQVPNEKVEDGEVFAIEGREPDLPEFSRRKNVGLIGDVGLFARVPNPYNTARTLTWCSGVYSRGVYGAVRTLTDKELRGQNEAYLGTRFGKATQFAILMRVPVLFGDALTPDLTDQRTRLYEWSDEATEAPGPGEASKTGHREKARRG